MKKANRKILGLIIFSSLILAGCNLEKIQAKREERKARILAEKEMKIKDMHLDDMPVHSVRIEVIKRTSSSVQVAPIPHTVYNTSIVPVGILKLDVNKDNKYSEQDGDFPLFFSLKNCKNSYFMSLLFGKNIEEFSDSDMMTLMHEGMLVKNKSIVCLVYPDNDMEFIGLISDGNLVEYEKPSEVVHCCYKNTKKMQELDKIFEEKYLNQR